MKKIDVNKPMLTRDCRRAELLGTIAYDTGAMIGYEMTILSRNDKNERVYLYNEYGHVMAGTNGYGDRNLDLFNPVILTNDHPFSIVNNKTSLLKRFMSLFKTKGN